MRTVIAAALAFLLGGILTAAGFVIYLKRMFRTFT